MSVRSRAETDSQRIDEEWGCLTWLASGELTDTDLTLGRVVIRRGQSNPRHVHDGCGEVLYLLAGQLRHELGEDELVLNAGDSITIPAGVPHCARNTGDADADMIVAFTSGTRDFRLVPRGE